MCRMPIRLPVMSAIIAVSAAACVSQSQYESTVMERDSIAAENVAMQTAYDSLNNLFAAEMEARDIEINQLVDGVELQIPSDILFSSGSVTASGSDASADQVRKLATYLAGTDFFISVVGHTDSQQPRGSLAARFPSNWEVGAARAANAVKFLQENGVNPTQMSAVSRGQYEPIATNDTEEGRSRNRRIQIILRNLPPSSGR